jgi:spermidine/putrescine transport system ATP-binding protein
MRAELRAIQKRTNVTFIYITHDQGEALAMSDRVAVMSRGKIQQIDVPQMIYNNPANGFVASFVGENNIFAGTLSSASKGEGKFETTAGAFTVRLGQDVSKTSSCHLHVRPEHIGFTAKPKASQNAIKAEVQDVSFEGNYAIVHLRDATGKKLIAEVRNDPALPPPQPGSSTYVTFDADKALVLLDSEAVAYGEKDDDA